MSNSSLMTLNKEMCSVVADSLQSHGLYVAGPAPLSTEYSRQEYWSGLPFPSSQIKKDKYKINSIIKWIYLFIYLTNIC